VATMALETGSKTVLEDGVNIPRRVRRFISNLPLSDLD
jgi:hypothetical protein